MSEPSAPEPGSTAEQAWPVREVTRRLTGYVARLGQVWIEGQLAQLTVRAGSSTAYASLRDAQVEMSLPLAIPRAVLESTAVREGHRVVVLAKPEFWPRRGEIQLKALAIRPVGVGALLARLEALRVTLAAEGLFASDRKRPLPFLPRAVGLVCGRGSAAERDVVENARRRWPAVRFEIREVAVQGGAAVVEVGDAVRALDADPAVEVIVVTRGGGSLEDLLPFSDEGLVRVVAACRTPVVSAIGHEQDVPLLDLVADLRASTPTDAARRVVPDVSEERERIDALAARAARTVQGRLTAELQWWSAMRARPVLADPAGLLRGQAAEVLALRERARGVLGTRIERAANDLDHLLSRVRALSPAATLERGYAVVDLPGDPGTGVLRDPAAAPPGTPLRIRLAGGRLSAVSTDEETS